MTARRRSHRIIGRLRALATCARVLALLTFVESTIRWMRLPRLARLLGVSIDLQPAEPAHPGPRDLPGLSARERRQLRCTSRVARRWPFSNGPCLRQSLVAAHLLRSSGATVRIGFPRSPSNSIAHAWVELNGVPLEDIDDYQPFARQAAHPR